MEKYFVIRENEELKFIEELKTNRFKLTYRSNLKNTKEFFNFFKNNKIYNLISLINKEYISKISIIKNTDSSDTIVYYIRNMLDIENKSSDIAYFCFTPEIVSLDHDHIVILGKQSDFIDQTNNLEKVTLEDLKIKITTNNDNGDIKIKVTFVQVGFNDIVKQFVFSLVNKVFKRICLYFNKSA